VSDQSAETTSSKRSKISKRNNAKGKEFEREVAIAMREIFPDAIRRLEFQKSQVNGADLDGTDPYRIQCKNYNTYAPLSKIEEVRLDKGIIPVLVTKGKRKKPIAALYLSDFIELLKQVHGTGKIDEGIDVDDFI
jgi:hypothetical protein